MRPTALLAAALLAAGFTAWYLWRIKGKLFDDIDIKFRRGDLGGGVMTNYALQCSKYDTLAEQITVESLKWHHDAVTRDLDGGAYKHQEDIEYFAKLSAALKLTLDYFGIPEKETSDD